jgi:hypothetical protein
MTRRVGMFVFLLCFTPTAKAELARSKEPFPRPDPQTLRKPAPVRTVPQPEFQLTEESEVVVDGKRRPYKDVPRGAAVLRIEVAQDRKTILRVEFTTTGKE